MPRIQKLPEQLIQRIAAGEVIERPASVLKEIIENALDAGARNIAVEWEEAGQKRLRVTDDGHGMAAEDVRLALERHATSKITSQDDLEQIKTFGFRGEALPSIAAVSRFQLTTRPPKAPEGWSIESHGGKIVREGPIGAPPGTTVLVEDLFYATPARRKFLKSEATEKGQLLRVVEDVSLSALSTHFQVFSDKKELFVLRPAKEGEPPEKALRARMETLWGASRLGALKPVRVSGRFLTVWGWISDVHSPQSSGRYQRFYVNGRPVTHRRISYALYEAYKGSLFVGKHPMAALFLEMDPSAVDVNVHPAKREVRFSHEEEIFGFIYNAVKETLAGGAAMPQALRTPEAPRETPGLERSFPPYKPAGRTTPRAMEARAAYNLQTPLPAVNEPAAEEPALSPIPLEQFRESKFHALLQMDKTYILARLDSQLFIFDQHAAAERVLYEKLAEASKNQAPHQQALLLPWVWELSAQAASVVNERLGDFGKLGYSLEPFGAQAFRVKAVPGALGDSPKVRGMLEGLVEDLISETIPKQWDAILVRAACRGSVKAQDPLQAPEMERIIADLQKCRSPWSCPHGRPTFLRLSPEELAKRFRRV